MILWNHSSALLISVAAIGTFLFPSLSSRFWQWFLWLSLLLANGDGNQVLKHIPVAEAECTGDARSRFGQTRERNVLDRRTLHHLEQHNGVWIYFFFFNAILKQQQENLFEGILQLTSKLCFVCQQQLSLALNTTGQDLVMYLYATGDGSLVVCVISSVHGQCT